MAKITLKSIAIMAMAGTSLSGCALINGAADTAWSGTKSVAKFVSSPVRSLLRDAPEAETQFAAVDVETVETVETAKVAKTAKAKMMVETVETVEATQVLGATQMAMPMPMTSTMNQTTSVTTSAYDMAQPASWLGATSSQVTTDFKAADVITVGSVSYVRQDGAGSIEDWQTCDTQAGGFWTFGTGATNGTINPKFESCMRNINYVQETQLSADMAGTLVPALRQASTTTALSPLP